MKEVLDRVQSGEFADAWIDESNSGSPNFNRMREEAAKHPIEEVGTEIRSKMRFAMNQMVDKTVN